MRRKGQECTPRCKLMLQCTGYGLQHAAFRGPLRERGRTGLGVSGHPTLLLYWPELPVSLLRDAAG